MPWLRWIFQPMQSSSRLSIWVLGASLRMRNTDRIGEGVVWMCDLGEGPGVVHSWLSPEVRHDSILARVFRRLFETIRGSELQKRGFQTMWTQGKGR